MTVWTAVYPSGLSIVWLYGWLSVCLSKRLNGSPAIQLYVQSTICLYDYLYVCTSDWMNSLLGIPCNQAPLSDWMERCLYRRMDNRIDRRKCTDMTTICLEMHISAKEKSFFPAWRSTYKRQINLTVSTERPQVADQARPTESAIRQYRQDCPSRLAEWTDSKKDNRIDRWLKR